MKPPAKKAETATAPVGAATPKMQTEADAQVESRTREESFETGLTPVENQLAACADGATATAAAAVAAAAVVVVVVPVAAVE